MLENLIVENSSVDLRMAQRMTCANFKSLLFNVWEEFLGQTDIHIHFLFYVIEDVLRQFCINDFMRQNKVVEIWLLSTQKLLKINIFYFYSYHWNINKPAP